MATLFSVAFARVIPTLAAATLVSLAQVHGTVVSIDRPHGTFMLHHDPFRQMPMAMTMKVAPKSPADLRRLHVGEAIDARVDISGYPWIASTITPATAQAHR